MAEILPGSLTAGPGSHVGIELLSGVKLIVDADGNAEALPSINTVLAQRDKNFSCRA